MSEVGVFVGIILLAIYAYHGQTRYLDMRDALDDCDEWRRTARAKVMRDAQDGIISWEQWAIYDELISSMPRAES